MKKVLLACLAIASTLVASAQADVVKSAQNALKGKNPDYQAVLKTLQPAMTNPETSKNVETWVLAGKASIGLYDNLFKQQAIGQAVDIPLMGNALMDGINYYVTALPLDSVPDEKGKVKAKNSKEILKQIDLNYNALNQMGVNLYNGQDYNGAYRAWEMFLELPKNPVFGANGPKAQPDTIMAEIAFNKGIAAWQADSLNNALKSFEQAIALGYDKKQVYDYAISIAVQLGDNNKVTELAEKGYPLFGNEDPKFLQLMINSKIEAEQYDEARKMLDDAIAAQPDNAQLYFVLGILEETLENNDAAFENYKKSVALDPEYAQALYALGRSICNQAYAVDDQGSQGKSQKEYEEFRINVVNPMFVEAAGYLEKAYANDPDNMHDALRYLRNVYYNLGDEENLKRVESL